MEVFSSYSKRVEGRWGSVDTEIRGYFLWVIIVVVIKFFGVGGPRKEGEKTDPQGADSVVLFVVGS